MLEKIEKFCQKLKKTLYKSVKVCYNEVVRREKPFNHQERSVRMNITIIGRKCTPRENFKKRAEKKLAKIEKFFGSDIDVKLTATVEKTSQTVEITIMHKGLIFRSQGKAVNLDDALDICVDALVRQIRKNKTRVAKRLREGNFDELIATPEVTETTEEAEELHFDVVRRKTIALKPQTLEDAILQMNLLGHKFFVFQNAESDEMEVVYAREDGGYGLIIPEFK
jgi:putative sigma-54 modulation protein